jgi:protein-disulfide isomerase
VVRSAAATAPPLDELATPVDPERDHVRGPEEAPVTLVEYGDYECPYCGRAEGTIRELLQAFSEELRYVYRHLPLVEVHPHAELAAEAAEAAGAQGRFWEMHDLLFANQRALEPADLRARAAQLELDVERFWEEVRSRVHARRVTEDVRSADESGVAGTPTFFINGRRHRGAHDVETLTAAIHHARHRYEIDAAAERARQPGSCWRMRGGY